MSNPKIWLSSPHLSGNENKYIQEALDSNWVAPLGPNVNSFELELGEKLGVKNVVALSSGTSALHLAMILLNVKPGDEVICQSFTFSATANPIAYQGATPVFVDSESETWNIDPFLLEETILDRIKKGKKPKAIVVVHLYGMPAKLDEILAVANKYEIPLVEDAAEAVGSSYNGKACGTFGEIGVLSFNGNKIITTSGGGALVSCKKQHIERSRYLATQAREDAPHYQHSEIGYNYRMSNIVAGIGRAQLEVLNDRVQRRRAINQFYKDLLKDVSGVVFLQEPSDKFFSNHWLTSIFIDPNKTNITREDVRQALQQDNIESRPLWKPMHLQPVFAQAPAYLNGTSDRLFEHGLCLPSSSNMTSLEKERIAKIISQVFNI